MQRTIHTLIALMVLMAPLAAAADSVKLVGTVQGQHAKHATVSFYLVDQDTGEALLEWIDTDLKATPKSSTEWVWSVKINGDDLEAFEDMNIALMMRVDARKSNQFMKVSEFKISVDGSDYQCNLHGKDSSGEIEWFAIEDIELGG